MSKQPSVLSRSLLSGSKLKDRSVLDINHEEAGAFFLKPESYCTVELPAYCDFGKVLSAVAEILKKEPPGDMSSKPREHEGVNYSLLSNKDGRHAWRPLQLIHPALYVSLVNHITERENREFIRERYKKVRQLKNFNREVRIKDAEWFLEG